MASLMEMLAYRQALRRRVAGGEILEEAIRDPEKPAMGTIQVDDAKTLLEDEPGTMAAQPARIVPALSHRITSGAPGRLGPGYLDGGRLRPSAVVLIALCGKPPGGDGRTGQEP